MRAVGKLLDRPDAAAVVLGEIGSGKSTVALASAAARGALRVLVLCPPHLLKSWADQARAVVPWARVVVLEDVVDVDRLAASDEPGMVVAILSRETAKLGHAWEGILGRCPRCGGDLPAGADELARKRVRCEHRALVAEGGTARLAERLALTLAPAATSARVQGLLRARIAQRLALRQAEAARKDGGAAAAGSWAGIAPRLAPIARRLAGALARADREPSTKGVEALAYLLLAVGDEDLSAEVIRILYAGPLADFRCFEYGVICDGDDPRTPGAKTGCVSREDSLYVHPVSRYGAFLHELKADPSMVMVAGIFGYAGPVGVHLVNVAEGRVALDGVCPGTSDPDRPSPAVRMHALAEQFPTRWVSAPICESEMAANLHRISDATSGVMAGSLCLLEEVPQDAVCRAFALGPKGTQRPIEVGLAVDRERCGHTDHGLRALLAPGALAEGERLRVECVK